MKMDMVTVEVETEVAGKGVEVDDGDTDGAHDFISYLIIGITVGGKAVESHVRLIVDLFITGGCPDPGQRRRHGGDQRNNGTQILSIAINVDLPLAGLGIGFDVMQAAVEQKEIGVKAALLFHAL
jgi:hypothetical protein